MYSPEIIIKQQISFESGGMISRTEDLITLAIF